MARIIRSDSENRRIGVPLDKIRIDVLERLVSKLLALSTIPGSDSDRQELGAIKDRLDQLDIDFPDAR